MTATTSPPQASPELPQGRGAGFLVTPEMEFRKETIYFIVIDRFFNSCPGNDRVGRDGLFVPSRRQWGHYWVGICGA